MLRWKTHKLVADKIHKVIEKDMGIKLNLRALKFGAVMPDFFQSVKEIKHVKEKAFDKFSNMIEEITKIEIPNSKIKVFNYSIKLGIILHYICDFFCMAHNYQEFTNLKRHAGYERKLANVFGKLEIEKLFINFCNGPDRFEINNTEELIRYIEDRHDKYVYQRGMDKDIRFSFEVCIITAVSIVHHSIMIAELAA